MRVASTRNSLGDSAYLVVVAEVLPELREAQ
jgi:hypothetical protein